MKQSLKLLTSLASLALLTSCGNQFSLPATSNAPGTLDVSKVLYGAGAPTAEMGASGSFYIDLDSGIVYLKVAENWVLRNRLGGPAFLTGEGAPAASLGFVGDAYFDLESASLYIKASNGWQEYSIGIGVIDTSEEPAQSSQQQPAQSSEQQPAQSSEQQPAQTSQAPTPAQSEDSGDPTPAGLGVSYDFSNLTDGSTLDPKAQGISENDLLGVFTANVTGNNIVTGAQGTKVYYANTNDGPKVKGIKFSSSSTGGSLSLSLSQSVSSATIKIYGWTSKALEDTNTIDVNGATLDLTEDYLTGKEYTFNFASSSTVTISSAKRFVITSLKF